MLAVVNGLSLPDAAVAASLVAAGLADAVVFAESADALSFNDAHIIRNREPVRLVLVGGTGALSSALEAELRGFVDGVQIDRLAGVDRMDTAALAAELMLAGIDEPTLALDNAWSRRDVISAAAAVVAGGADALVYTADGWLGTRAREVLTAHQPKRLVVAGTPETFSHDMVTQALSITDAAGPPARLDGPNSGEARSTRRHSHRGGRGGPALAGHRRRGRAGRGPGPKPGTADGQRPTAQ